MSTLIINGVMGNQEKSNAVSVRFNLTANSESHNVHGSVQIKLGSGILHSGNVEGTLNTTNMGDYIKFISLHGYIPANDPLNPHLKLPFNANMYLEAENKGEGEFNFRGIYQEQLPIVYRQENL